MSFLKATPVSESIIRESATRFIDSVKDQIVLVEDETRQAKNRPSADSDSTGERCGESENCKETKQVSEKGLAALKAIVARIRKQREAKRPEKLLGLNDVWEQINVQSGRQKNTISKELLDKDFCRRAFFRVAKKTLSLVWPTKEGCRLACEPACRIPGKGSFPHNWTLFVLEKYWKERGCTCQIEGTLNGKHADLVIRTPDGKTIAYESSMSSAHVIENAKADLKGGGDEVIFVAPTSSVLKQVQKVIRANSDLAGLVGNRIKFELVGKYVEL